MKDAHTHCLQPAWAAVINLPREALLAPADFSLLPAADYSAGVHPWWTEEATDLLWQGVEQWARHPQVTVIGECGFDRLRGDLDRQHALFVCHARLAERLGRPLLLHCVRAFDLLLGARRSLRPSVPWIVHGFRGRPALARQLLAAGFDLSFGPRFNAESLRLCPADRRHIETDDSGLSLQEVAARIAAASGIAEFGRPFSP